MHFIGIDVAKKSFVAAFPNHSGFDLHTFDNTHEGMEQFLSLLTPDSHCVMEATGVYHLKLAVFLYEKQISVSVVNPLSIKRFCQMNLSKIKTDRADAKRIAQYGSIMCPEKWQPTPTAWVQVHQDFVLLETLISHRVIFANLRKSFTHTPNSHPHTLERLDWAIEDNELKIKELEIAIGTAVQTLAPEEYELVCSIPGVGQRVASVFLILTEGGYRFEHPGQLIAYIGLNPCEYQSGTSIHKQTRISKTGSPTLRKILFSASLSASRYNPMAKGLYQRLIEKKKAKKQALIAVCNKLIRQIFGVLKHRKPFDPNYLQALPLKI